MSTEEKVSPAIEGLKGFLRRDRDRIDGIHNPEMDEGCLKEARAHLQHIERWAYLMENLTEANRFYRRRLEIATEMWGRHLEENRVKMSVDLIVEEEDIPTSDFRDSHKENQ